ncbi:VOC family protein [Portibacter lacus]|uniref:VOC family protein n=1 Tax=Portibacter lacus TaxID=1099794 RepID=A0AA37WD21_9BACT|nr:VOC family protein [Portibacter lacus]GLR16423.1 VOC family protein [Portibacter lacus]
MKSEIIPCLWFDGQAKAASSFYASVFNHAEILSSSDVITQLSISRRTYHLLDGGPMFKLNDSISLYVYCGSDAEIERLYPLLMEGGSVIMPLGSYGWCRKYAMVKDQFGVIWQLDVDPINNYQNIVPTFLFANEQRSLINEAMSFYQSVFPNSMTLMEVPYPADSPMEEGSVLFGQYKLNGNIFNAMSSSEEQKFKFNEAFSFVVQCDTQEEIDKFWDALISDGGSPSQCGWLKDKYGISWQIVPAILEKLMSDPDKAPYAMKAFLKMNKFVIADLEE